MQRDDIDKLDLTVKVWAMQLGRYLLTQQKKNPMDGKN